MNPLIEEKQLEIIALCKKFRVRNLELFGSVASQLFDAETSDLDFLVSFDDLDLGPGLYADAYFGLLEGLQDLFQRPVDLVVASVVNNPYFLNEIAKTRTLLYAA